VSHALIVTRWCASSASDWVPLFIQLVDFMYLHDNAGLEGVVGYGLLVCAFAYPMTIHAARSLVHSTSGCVLVPAFRTTPPWIIAIACRRECACEEVRPIRRWTHTVWKAVEDEQQVGQRRY
jgi:hypothetical protein